MSMDPLMADLILAEARAAQARTRAAIRRAMAIPLGLLAATYCVASPVVLAIGRGHMMPFFGLAFLLASVVAWFAQRQAARGQGVRPTLIPWVATIVVLLVCASATSKIGHDQGWDWLNLAGPLVVTAMATLVLAWWVRSRDLSLVAGAMPVVSLVVVLRTAGDAAVAIQAGVYAALLAVGCWRMRA